MNQMEQQKNNFLQELSKETELSISQIRRILADAEVDTFSPLKMATYRAIVLANAGMYLRVGQELAKETKRPKCLMPGCKGFRVKGSGNFTWLCTEGGKRHYLAVQLAEATGQKPEDALVTLTDMKNKADKQDAKARAEWLEQMVNG